MCKFFFPNGSLKWFTAQQDNTVYPNSGRILAVQLVLPSQSTVQDRLKFRSSTEIQTDETDVRVVVCLCVLGGSI